MHLTVPAARRRAARRRTRLALEQWKFGCVQGYGLFEDLLGALDEACGRAQNLIGRELQHLTRDRAELGLGVLEIPQEQRVLHRGLEGPAQCRDTLGRSATRPPHPSP